MVHFRTCKITGGKMALELYMIRNGLFAQDYGFKLILILIGLLICILFLIFAKKYDYLFVFLTGIIIWSVFELIMTAEKPCKKKTANPTPDRAI